jgi:hypothetical protein
LENLDSIGFHCHNFFILSSYFQAPVPIKLTVKKFIGDDWMVACMVPKGNMMHCMVREVEGTLQQIKYNITAKELPVEIMEMEGVMADFLEGGITDIKREGD